MDVTLRLQALEEALLKLADAVLAAQQHGGLAVPPDTQRFAREAKQLLGRQAA